MEKLVTLEMLNDMEINDAIKKIDEIKNTESLKIRKESKFLKILIYLAIGFLSLLVSLKRENLDSYNEKLFFFLTILLISIGILFGIIQLSLEIHVQKRILDFHYEELRKLSHGDKADWIYSDSVPLIYKLSIKLCYLFLVFGLISVVLYSYFSIF